jgi:rhodanese-related sulfurtransferase
MRKEFGFPADSRQETLRKSQRRVIAGARASLWLNPRRNHMKTIRPLTLEALLEASQPVEIVDIRPRAEFEKVHIEGAHSIPSAEISAEKLVVTRELLQTEPLYLVSESGALAQLQACELERQGLDNVVIVSGGMHRWQSDGLPVVWHHPMADWLAERCDRICAVCRGKDPARTAVHCAI